MMTALKAMMALLLLMSTAGVPSVEETDDGLSTRAARLSAWRRSNSQRSGRAGGDAESGACRPPQAGDAPHAAPVVHAHAHSSVEVTLPPGEVGTDDPFKADGLSMQREWTAYSALKLSMAVPHPADALVGLRLKADPGQTQAVGVTAARPSIHVVCSGLVAGSLYWLDASFYKHGEQVFQESQPLEAPVERAHSSVEVTLPPDTAGMHHVDLTLFDAVDATMLAKRTNVKHAFPERLLVSCVQIQGGCGLTARPVFQDYKDLPVMKVNFLKSRNCNNTLTSWPSSVTVHGGRAGIYIHIWKHLHSSKDRLWQ